MGAVLRLHVAWFHRAAGHWLGEWVGDVAPPDIDPQLPRPLRDVALDAWLFDVQQLALAGQLGGRGMIDETAFSDTPAGGAVCLDVTRFAWPLGDHERHVYSDYARLLDWPEASVHRFIEVQLETRAIVGLKWGHRPIRSAVPGQVVFDVHDETPAALPAAAQLALEAARIDDLDVLFNNHAQQRERVRVR